MPQEVSTSFKFIENINDFVSKRFSQKTMAYTIELGLQTYLKFEGFKTGNFYLMNNDNFEFDLIKSIPDNDKLNLPKTDYFDFLVKIGTIGKALKTGDPIFHSHDSLSTTFAVMPLISVEGVIGIVILISDLNISQVEFSSINSLRIFNSLFASTLSELILEESEKRTKDLMEQMVASRTLSLQEDSRKLGDKFESVTSSISMIIPHEVRTPITHILGMTDYLKSHLKDTSEDSEALEVVDYIHSAAKRLNRLFENYILYANLVVLSNSIRDIERLQQKFTQNANAVIYDSVMNIIYYNGRKDDTSINLVEATIAMEEIYLIKICEELTDNALKYSEKGSKINVSSYIDKSNYVLSIMDEGKGMTKEEIEKIGAYIQFEREKNEQQGSGLGLAIVRKILSLHRGDIQIHSKKEEYTKFTITIPLSVGNDM